MPRSTGFLRLVWFVIIGLTGASPGVSAQPARPFSKASSAAPHVAPVADRFAQAEAFIGEVHPELAAMGRLQISFETWRQPFEPRGGTFSGWFFVRLVSEKDLRASHLNHALPLEPTLAADMTVRDTGEVIRYSMFGCPYSNLDRIAPVYAALTKEVDMTEDALRGVMRDAGMRFIPGQREQFIEHVRPVLDAIERRAGLLTIDSVEEPRRWTQEYPSGMRAEALLRWTIRARAIRGKEERQVTLGFDPFDGRLLTATIDRK
jgi:hypothetical protein